MPRSLTALAAIAAVAGAAPAPAQQKGGQTIVRATVVSSADKAFAAMDSNHDGSLNSAEIGAAQNREIANMNAQLRAQSQALFKQLDTNKDGQLSQQEFAATATTAKLNGGPAEVLQKLDSNRDGKISAAEYRAPRRRAEVARPLWRQARHAPIPRLPRGASRAESRAPGMTPVLETR